MSAQEPPKIEFPCADYPIKVLGEHSEDYKLQVLEVFEVHAPGFDRGRVTFRESSKASFLSITVYIEASGLPQLENLHQALKALRATRMVI